MTVLSNSNSSDASTYSTPDDHLVRNFAKHMLKGKIFIGNYIEKRHCADLNAYRDVILVNRTETEFITALDQVFRKIKKHYPTHWHGYTTPSAVGAPAGYTLWVELPETIFGNYWFKVKTVNFRRNEICLQLTQVRTVDSEIKTVIPEVTINQISEDLIRTTKEFGANLYALLTVENIKNTIIFISVMLMTLITGSIQLLKFLSEFSLKFVREMSIFVNAATPFFLGIIGFFEKIVGGFYILIAMIWKDATKPKSTNSMSQQPSIEYHRPPQYLR